MSPKKSKDIQLQIKNRDSNCEFTRRRWIWLNINDELIFLAIDGEGKVLECLSESFSDGATALVAQTKNGEFSLAE